jgi:hypothetical protein
MTDLERLRDALTESWKGKHGPSLNLALGNLRGHVTSLRKRRQKAFKWAQSILPALEQARAELGRSASDQELCDWLNAHQVTGPNGGRFHRPKLHEQIASVADTISADLVLECRTRMSARSLSANFQVSLTALSEFEAECIERIGEAINLTRQLLGDAPLTGDALQREAKDKAHSTAKAQRVKDYAPMLGRDCFMTPDEYATISTVFEPDNEFWKSL